jgi:hypothetical protein
MSTDCPYTGNNKTQKAICECLESSKALSASIKSYEDTLASNATATDNYNKADANYKRDKATWDEKRRVRIRELENEEKQWNNCVLWTEVYGHDNWCQGDTGFGRQVGAGGYGCMKGQGKGNCKRTPSQVNSDIAAWATGENVEPQAPSQPPLVNPIPPSATIQCCGISIDNLTSNSLSLADISQKCTTAAGDGGGDSSGGDGGGDGGGNSSGDDSTDNLFGLSDNNQIYMITGIIFLIIFIMLSFVLLLVASSDN